MSTTTETRAESHMRWYATCDELDKAVTVTLYGSAMGFPENIPVPPGDLTEKIACGEPFWYARHGPYTAAEFVYAGAGGAKIGKGGTNDQVIGVLAVFDWCGEPTLAFTWARSFFPDPQRDGFIECERVATDAWRWAAHRQALHQR